MDDHSGAGSRQIQGVGRFRTIQGGFLGWQASHRPTHYGGGTPCIQTEDHLLMSQQRPRASRPSLPSPSTGTMGAAVAVIALLLGFLVLRDVFPSSSTPSTPTETVPGGGTVDPNASTTTVPFSTLGFKLIVANASGVAGSAGSMTLQLQNLGFIAPPAVNLAPGAAKRQKTGVFYTAGCENNANKVAEVLGGNVDIAAMPVPVPTETGELGEACVLILLGTDLAGKPLQGATGTGQGQAATTTTAPPAG